MPSRNALPRTHSRGGAGSWPCWRASGGRDGSRMPSGWPCVIKFLLQHGTSPLASQPQIAPATMTPSTEGQDLSIDRLASNFRSGSPDVLP